MKWKRNSMQTKKERERKNGNQNKNNINNKKQCGANEIRTDNEPKTTICVYGFYTHHHSRPDQILKHNHVIFFFVLFHALINNSIVHSTTTTKTQDQNLLLFASHNVKASIETKTVHWETTQTQLQIVALRWTTRATNGENAITNLSTPIILAPPRNSSNLGNVAIRCAKSKHNFSFIESKCNILHSKQSIKKKKRFQFVKNINTHHMSL